jgi:predicted phosphohydrolase
MRVFAIGDLHLEGGTGKTMDMFGEHWRDHDRKIFEAWEREGRDDDLLILAGDTSWAMRLEDAKSDLDRIGRLKGRKVMIKGNHDYWWSSLSKLRRLLHPSIEPLQASSVVIDRVAIAGTRGWVCPNDSHFGGEDEKIYQREVGRLKIALESLKAQRLEYDRLIVALHYPPANRLHEPSGFTELIDQYEADACVYGHLHGEDIRTGLTGLRSRTQYYLVSADSVSFSPAQIMLSGIE